MIDGLTECALEAKVSKDGAYEADKVGLLDGVEVGAVDGWAEGLLDIGLVVDDTNKGVEKEVFDGRSICSQSWSMMIAAPHSIVVYGVSLAPWSSWSLLSSIEVHGA